MDFNLNFTHSQLRSSLNLFDFFIRKSVFPYKKLS